MHVVSLTRTVAGLRLVQKPAHISQPCFTSPSLISRWSPTSFSPSSYSRSFYTAKQSPNNSNTKSKTATDSRKKNDGTTANNPDMPTARFSELGATRTVRVVVIVVVSVLATIETVFWLRVGWARFGW